MECQCVLEIQEGSQIAGSSNISENCDIYHQNSNGEPTALTVQEMIPMMTDNRKWRPKPETVPTTNLRLKTMYMWKIVLASEYTRAINIDNDMAPKPEIITSLEL